MRCPKCDAKLKDTLSRCNQCGQDLSIIKHVLRISNTYYNKGLEKATVRDLSGAVVALRKSLQYNKANTDARNLLGLVLCEMGETVAALSEWVLSKYLQAESNDADYYIAQIQNNPIGLDSVNQTIKKYNAALSSAKSGSEDLAVIQLKKVVSLNPKFVRAHQLLALLYMNMGEYNSAYKALKFARRIDYNNTTTLRYMQEVGVHLNSTERKENDLQRKKTKKDPLENVTPVGSYREEKRQLLPIFSVIIGIMIGVLVSIVLIYPTLGNKSTNQNSTAISDLNAKLVAKTAELTKANQSIKDVEKELTALKNGTSDEEDTGMLTKYEDLLKGVNFYLNDDKSQAAVSVASYKESDFELAEAKELFGTISKELSKSELNDLFTKGRDKYNQGKLEEAIVALTTVIEADPENQDALYFLGRVYDKKGDVKKAKKYYNKVIKVDETTSRASQAKAKISALPKTESEPTPTPEAN